MDQINTILFDFHGVLCDDRFYSRLETEHTDAHAWIDKNVFRAGHPILKEWMRGEVGFRQVNRMIAGKTGFSEKKLNQLFVHGVKDMRLDMKLLRQIKELRCGGKRVGLVTDNMDIFTSVFVPHKELGKNFDAIVNSADYGLLKGDNDGKLFDLALERLGESTIGKCLLVDDTKSVIDLFCAKGGQGHQYVSSERYLDRYAVLA